MSVESIHKSPIHKALVKARMADNERTEAEDAMSTFLNPGQRPDVMDALENLCDLTGGLPKKMQEQIMGDQGMLDNVSKQIDQFFGAES